LEIDDSDLEVGGDLEDNEHRLRLSSLVTVENLVPFLPLKPIEFYLGQDMVDGLTALPILKLSIQICQK
jgi:hypothetical protein